MKRTGRPPTPKDEQVTVVRLPNRHVALMDQIIRERSERALRAVVNIVPEHKIPGTEITTWRDRVEAINYSSERRELLTLLIEEGLTTDELFPTRVLPKVPRGPYSEMELVQISDWAEGESLRLTENAPLPVKIVLTRNKLRKMERDLSPEEYLEKLRDVTQDVPEERRVSNDDEKTS